MTHPDVHDALARLWVAQLRAAREFRRLSQNEVGDRSGMSGQHIWKWESGRNLPSVPHLAAWAEAVGMELQLVPASTKRDKEN